MDDGMKTLKNHLPTCLREALRWLSVRLNPIPGRYGPDFLRTYAFVNESQWWSHEQLRQHQFQRLSTLLKHAYENVPYYRESFRECGFEPGDFKALEDLGRLPLLTKETLREDPDRLLAVNHTRWSPTRHQTSGTTGKPVHFWVDRQSDILESALVWRHRNWAGYAFGDRRATFRQHLGVSGPGGAPWVYEPEEHNLGFYAFSVDDASLARYCAKLKTFRPVMLRGYPSYLSVFAKFVRHSGGEDFPPIRCVIASSEMLYPAQRQEMESAFGCKVFNWYGCGEQIVNAQECDAHAGLHVNMERGVLELLRNGGAAAPGEPGEVVATGLDNYSMPLIRYRVGDLAVWKERPCACGRKSPLLASLQGRESEVLRARDGRYVFTPGIIDVVDGITAIKESQLVQESAGDLVVRIVRSEDYRESDSCRLVANLERALGDRLAIRLEFVDRIERTGAGKYRWIVTQPSSGNDAANAGPRTPIS